MVDWKSFITTWSFFYYYVAIFFVACPPPPCVHASNKSLSALLSKQRMKSTTQNNAQPSTSAAAAQGTVTPSSSAQPVQQQHQQQRDMPRLYSSLIAGVGSGALASVICAPLDLIRTRLQVWTEVKHGSPTMAIPQMLRDIVKREGVTGCFRGLGATLLTVPLFWGVYFPLYDDFKRTWSLQFPTTDTTFIHMGAAVSAGVISDIICNPMFVVRTRLQTEALHQIMSSSPGLPTKMSMLQTAKSLYKEGGPFIFWRGMTANLMGLSHVGVQFPVYEKLKLFFRQHKKHESPIDLLLASGLSKMTASLLTYPHEVIRSRMMDSRARVGFIDTCRRIYTAEGMAGFYAGLPITLIRVIPNTCITFVTYELILRWAREQILHTTTATSSSSSSSSPSSSLARQE